ncbi:phosphate acetyltransferase [Escherichia coli]|nr:phosphate acetyltransferase [Escherichia coli]
MSRIIMLIPTGTSVGLTSVSLGVIRAMERKGVRLSVFKPIAQPRTGGDAPDQTTTIVRANSSTTTAAEPLKMSYVEGLLSSNQKDVLMEEIVANYHANTKDAEVVLVEGLVPTRKHQFAQSLNYEIAKTLNAEIVFVMSQGTDTPEQLKERIELTRNSFGGAKNTNITGVIVNKLNAPVDEQGRTRPDLSEIFDDSCNSFGGAKNTNITGVIVNKLNAPVDEQGRTRPDLSEIFDDSSKAKVNNVDPAKLQESSPLPVLGAVPWSFDLIATRAIDMARHLNATIINEGDINTRRVKSVTFCARSIPHMLEHFRAGSLLVTSADRPDVLVAACLAAMNGVEIGALLLTGGYEMDARISKLCERAFATGLPVFMVNTNTWQTSLSLQSFNLEVPVDDHERIEKVQEYVANYINADWIESLTATSERSRRLSPPAFRYQLTELARKAGKRIVLPEGDEPRTVKAAAICAERGIATCVLLGNPAEINRVAASQGVELGAGIEIVDPEVVRESYVGRLVELRKNKGMTETVAREQLEDNVVLGTLMLEQDEVDGLVSGAVHTTANTIRPPLQLIKTAPGSSLVSSVFFMLLPEQVYVYGDCAINPDPTAEQLAEIAIQSADSAAAFGIEPRVAMLSYSTGTSGAGSDVEKVREATRLAQEKRPDLMIDGPLQYDAAVMADVAKSKAPNSPVAGRATVFIFPDLNTGNTTYKAVQRSADLISIGPMLQGMRKPVNDLSRGALVDDIVYTIALTAIQSAQQQ